MLNKIVHSCDIKNYFVILRHNYEHTVSFNLSGINLSLVMSLSLNSWNYIRSVLDTTSVRTDGIT